MSYNGSGTFSLPAGNPVVTGTVISSTWANTTLAQIATGLSTAILKDGQQTVTADIPFGTHKLREVSPGIATTDAANVEQLQNSSAIYLNNIAGTNTITASFAGTVEPSIYAAGQIFSFIPVNRNTGATTIAPGSLTAKNIFLDGTALNGGELLAGVPALIMYDGTQFQILSNTEVTSGQISLFRFFIAAQISAVVAGAFAVDVTAPITTAISTGHALYAPQGGYLYTQLDWSNCPKLTGDGLDKTLFKPTAVAGNYFAFGKGATNDSGVYANFGVIGNATTLVGIWLGGAGNALLTLNDTFQNVAATGFTAAGAANWYMYHGQDCNFIDCQGIGGDSNILRPDVNWPWTTLIWGGEAAMLDGATGDASINIKGSVSTWKFSGTCRSNAKEAIKQTAPTMALLTGHTLDIQGLWMEDNNTSNTAALAEVDCEGYNSGGNAAFQLIMSDVQLWKQAHTSGGSPFSMAQLRLDYVDAIAQRTLGGNDGGSGLNLTQVEGTANARLVLLWNSFLNGIGSDIETALATTPFLGQIFIEDKDANQSYKFTKGEQKFADNVWIAGSTAPIASGQAIGLQIGTTQIGVYLSIGAPTFTAATGSLCINTTGSAANNRLFINIGGAFWTNFVTAA